MPPPDPGAGIGAMPLPQVSVPAPQPGQPATQGMMTIELSNRDNKINWKTSAIRISLKTAHDHMFPQDTAVIHVMPGKFTGPYQVRVNKKLGEALVADGEVDIFSIESDSDVEQMVFNVYQVDDQGRRVGVEVTSRVVAARGNCASQSKKTTNPVL